MKSQSWMQDDSSSSFVDSLSGLGFSSALARIHEEEEEDDDDDEEEEEEAKTEECSPFSLSLRQVDNDNDSVDSMKQRSQRMAQDKEEARSRHLWGVLAPTTMTLGTMLGKLSRDNNNNAVVDEDDGIVAAGMIQETTTTTTQSSTSVAASTTSSSQ